MNRRGMLTGIGVALSGVVAGCLGVEGVLGGEEDEFDPAIESTTRLGSADQVSISAVPEREYEYIEDDDSVHLTYDSGTTSEMPFTEWGTRRAAAAGLSHLRSLFESEGLLVDGIILTGGETDLSTLDDPPPESAFKRAVSIGPNVRHMALYSRDGTLLNRPGVEFDEIVATTPRSIEVTMRFPERDYRAILPVFCRRGWLRQE